MKIAVIGSRTFNDAALLEKTLLEKLDINAVTTLVSGGAKGADSLAEAFAAKHGLTVQIFKPDWKQFGRGAGIIRNKEIIAAADQVIAFWDGKSKGTLSSINIAKKLCKPLVLVEYNSTSFETEND